MLTYLSAKLTRKMKKKNIKNIKGRDKKIGVAFEGGVMTGEDNVL